jgi:hypothetical protein
METKAMKNNIVVIVLSLALAGASYLLGFSNVTLRDFEMREARGRLGINLLIYEDAERGDLTEVKSRLGMVILGQTRIYEQQFGAPIGTDAFAQKFAMAQLISAQVANKLVSVKSILPGIKVTFSGTSDTGK